MGDLVEEYTTALHPFHKPCVKGEIADIEGNIEWKPLCVSLPGSIFAKNLES